MNSRLLYMGLALGCGILICVARADEPPTNSIAQTNSLPDFDSLLKLAERKQFSVFFNSKVIQSLTQAQCNQIAVIGARSLVETNETKGTNSAPSARSINYDALMLLSNLDERKVIQTSEVVPYLIDGLSVTKDDPACVNFEIILNILNYITRRNIGYVHGQDDWLRANQIAIADWWQNWWRENKDLHPVYDKQLETILRNEILATDAKITEAKPTQNFLWDSSTHFLLQNGRVDDDGERNWGPRDTLFTFFYGHTPGNTFKNGFYSPPADDVLYLCGEFLTKDPGETNGPFYSAAFGNKKFPMQEISSRTVPGTGIAIKVEIATTNAALVNVLRKYLNE